MAVVDGTVEFSGEQVEELRTIVEMWVSEGFTTPPYTDLQYDIFEKLGVTGGDYDVRRPS